MEKNIKDYLHLYLGCEVRLNDRAWNGKLVGMQAHGDKEDVLIEFPFNLTPDEDWAEYTRDYKFKDFRPLLRPLSDMKEEEMAEYNKLYSTLFSMADGINQIMQHAACDRYLLSKGFDLFGLIHAGLAIDRTTLTQKS